LGFFFHLINFQAFSVLHTLAEAVEYPNEIFRLTLGELLRENSMQEGLWKINNDQVRIDFSRQIGKGSTAKVFAGISKEKILTYSL
jgi:hypothetical protein